MKVNALIVNIGLNAKEANEMKTISKDIIALLSKNPNYIDIFLLLAKKPNLRYTEIQDWLMNEHKISRSSAYRHLHTLVNHEVVKKTIITPHLVNYNINTKLMKPILKLLRISGHYSLQETPQRVTHRYTGSKINYDVIEKKIKITQQKIIIEP